ncbi:hypothetical protein Tco_0624753 [Tanacetum coccineum]|uniref:Uncharacterized protein n=1 Tax=Tanacetum coccineum TaxID=301880 RepID=A0ABQ4WET3_9ASTR
MEISETFPLETLDRLALNPRLIVPPWLQIFRKLPAGTYLSRECSCTVPSSNERGTHFCNGPVCKVMLKYGSRQSSLPAYHLQDKWAGEVSNRGLKRNLEKGQWRKTMLWSDKLDDTLCLTVQRTQTPIEVHSVQA